MDRRQHIVELIHTQLPDLRPSLIKIYHDKRIEEFKEEYKKVHKGKKPSEDMLSNYSIILIAKKTALEDADNIINGLADKILDEFKKDLRRKKCILTLVNSIIFAMLLTLAGNFIALYLSTIKTDILGTYNPLTFPNALNAIIIILMTVIYYIYSFFEK